jgi:DNA-binding beta-propeller fold protein YncE
LRALCRRIFTEVSANGIVLLNGITGGGVLHPQGIAVDGAGTVWVANYRGSSISELSGASRASPGTFLSPASVFGTDAALLEPYGLALDASGDARISNFGKQHYHAVSRYRYAHQDTIRRPSQPSLAMADFLGGERSN